jgi:hypothetical protein
MLEKAADVSTCPDQQKGSVPFCIDGGALQLTCCVCGSTYMFSPGSRVSLDEFVEISQQLLETHKSCKKIGRLPSSTSDKSCACV